jgi:uncharacterized membrane protein (DUF2068 family)
MTWGFREHTSRPLCRIDDWRLDVDGVDGRPDSHGVDFSCARPSTWHKGAMRDHLTSGSSAESLSLDASAAPHSVHDGGLLAIGLFKLAKSMFFVAVGLGAIHLLHKDLADEVTRLARTLRFDPEGRFVELALSKVELIDIHRLRMIGLGSFLYSALALTEGIGLMLEKVWAEYLTLTLTISFLPWELYEIVRRPDWLHGGLLLINLAVLGYLIWLLQRKRQRQGLGNRE